MSFPREIWRIIFFYCGPFTFPVIRIVCKHWKSIIDSREFKEMAKTPTCVISKRWHPGISPLVANIPTSRLPNLSPEWKTMTENDELVHFLPVSYHISALGKCGNFKMPIQMALTTNSFKIESAKKLDQQFPPIDITIITEPIQDQRNCEAELEEKMNIYIQSKEDDFKVEPSRNSINQIQANRNWNDQ